MTNLVALLSLVCFSRHMTLKQHLIKANIIRRGSNIDINILHGPSMLADTPILVECSIINPTFSVLRRYLVIGLFSFSLLFIGHHQFANLV